MTRTAEFPIVCDLPDLQAKHEQSKRVHLIQDTKDREGRKVERKERWGGGILVASAT